MSDSVVDSCVLAKWVLTEADTALALRLQSEVVLKGELLFALDLGLIEVNNAIWKQYHQKRITAAKARSCLTGILAAPLQIVPSSRLLAPALEIAMKYDRALYDALFVALASDLKLTGVTADEPLVKAVAKDYPNIVLLRNWQP